MQTRYPRPGCLPQQGVGSGVSFQLLPVLLGQVGLHVKEDVLPLLDGGIYLLNQLRLLQTGPALVPVVRGVGIGEAGALPAWRKNLEALATALPLFPLNVSRNLSLHLYSLGLMQAPC